MPLPQVVIDTNVIVAGLRSRRGSAFQLLSLIDTGQFEIHLSVPLVLEYRTHLGSFCRNVKDSGQPFSSAHQPKGLNR
jgi:predicted nucleic acid-binding protein